MTKLTAATDPYLDVLKMVREAVESNCLPNTTVLVITHGDDGLLEFSHRNGVHFPSSGGEYAGFHPASSTEALAHLGEMRERGADYLVIPSSNSWWLEHYREFSRHLLSETHLLWKDQACQIFQLSDAPLQEYDYEPALPRPTGTVDLIITSHNKGEFLEETLASVRSQRFSPDNVIVIDDSSTDSTPAIVAGADALYKRVEFRSPGRARNAGANLSNAEFLCFLDGDDLLSPQFLEAHLRALADNPAAGFAFGRIREFGAYHRLWPNQYWDHDLLRRWNYIPGASVMRREAFDQVGGYRDLAAAEDWGLWLDISAAGWSGAQCQATWLWRRTPTSRNSERTFGRSRTWFEEVPLECLSINIVVQPTNPQPGLSPLRVRNLAQSANPQPGLSPLQVNPQAELSRSRIQNLAQSANPQPGLSPLRVGDFTLFVEGDFGDLDELLLGLLKEMEWETQAVIPADMDGDLRCVLVRQESLTPVVVADYRRSKRMESLLPEASTVRKSSIPR